MFKLYNLYKEVILESVHRDKIYDAINKKQRVNITYDDGTHTHTGKRTIEVYVFGRLNNSNPVGKPAIRAYQVFGDTKSGYKKDEAGNKVKVPKWKTFLVDKITSWEPVNFHFYTPISDRDPSLQNMGMAYREDGGDDLFGTIWASAEFNHDKYDKKKSIGVFSDKDAEVDKSKTSKVKWGDERYQEPDSNDDYEDEPYKFGDYSRDKVNPDYEEEPTEPDYGNEPTEPEYSEDEVEPVEPDYEEEDIDPDEEDMNRFK
jgi:hypothetical protein